MTNFKNVELENYKGATIDDCITYAVGDVESYLKDYFEAESISATENLMNKRLIDVPNFNQKKLNEHYNFHNRDDSQGDITNTCTIVACLGLVHYFGNDLGEFYIEDKMSSNVFVKIFDHCYENGYTTRNLGTPASKVNNCLTSSFELYGSERKGNTNWYNLDVSLLENINIKNEPLILDLKKHSTVACGITTFSYSGLKKFTTGSLWWKKTEVRSISGEIAFIIVNEGLGYDTRSLVLLDKITNITDDIQVCIPKL